MVGDSRVQKLFGFPKKGETLATQESFTAGEISGMDTVSWGEKREETGGVETCGQNTPKSALLLQAWLPGRQRQSPPGAA